MANPMKKQCSKAPSYNSFSIGLSMKNISESLFEIEKELDSQSSSNLGDMSCKTIRPSQDFDEKDYKSSGSTSPFKNTEKASSKNHSWKI